MMHTIAAKAVALFEAMQPEFASYQKAVLANAQALAGELKRLGLRLVSGGTDNHLVLVDLTDTGITGRAAEQALDSVGITANKNAIPFDSRPPRIASGLRLGTPAITTRGLGVEQTKEVADLIVKTLSGIGDEKVYRDVRAQVSRMAAQYPVPG